MSFSIRRFPLIFPALALSAAAGTLTLAQTAPPAGATAVAPAGPAAPNPTKLAIESLRAALAQVTGAISALDTEHWKVPGAVRAAADEDVASVQRDLTTTLPPLLDQAEAPAKAAAPAAIAPSFAVFRNVEALYDVLLRISETATLARSSDADRLEDARATLETARAQLGNALLQSIAEQDTQLAQIHSTPPPAATPPPSPAPSKIVVDDGPVTPKTHHKKKPAATSPPQ